MCNAAQTMFIAGRIAVPGGIQVQTRSLGVYWINYRLRGNDCHWPPMPIIDNLFRSEYALYALIYKRRPKQYLYGNIFDNTNQGALCKSPMQSNSETMPSMVRISQFNGNCGTLSGLMYSFQACNKWSLLKYFGPGPYQVKFPPLQRRSACVTLVEIRTQ